MYDYDRNVLVDRAMQVLDCKTQKELAEKLNCAESKISNVRNGKTSFEIVDLIRIATKGKCSIDWLLGFDLKEIQNEELYNPTLYDFIRMLVFLMDIGAVQLHTNTKGDGTEYESIHPYDETLIDYISQIGALYAASTAMNPYDAKRIIRLWLSCVREKNVPLTYCHTLFSPLILTATENGRANEDPREALQKRETISIDLE